MISNITSYYKWPEYNPANLVFLMLINVLETDSNLSHISAATKKAGDMLRQNRGLLLISQICSWFLFKEIFYKTKCFWLRKCWGKILSPISMVSVISVFSELRRSTVPRLSHHPVCKFKEYFTKARINSPKIIRIQRFWIGRSQKSTNYKGPRKVITKTVNIAEILIIQIIFQL